MTEIVVREPDMYGPHSRSLLADIVLANALRDAEAIDRLRRHQEREQRVNPNTTAGTGGEFAPPSYFIDMFKTSAHIGRPFANAIGSMPLPPSVSSINIPKFISSSIQGGSTQPQAGQGSADALVDETSTNLTSQVITIAGEADVSQQLYDLTPNAPGYDKAVGQELTLDYNARLENQLINGTGTAGQLAGISSFTPPASNTVSGTTATTVDAMWPLLGQVAANVGNNRGIVPEYYLMAPRRWMWIASAVDGSKRPLASPRLMDQNADLLPEATTIPALLSGALNTGSAPDTIWAVRPSELLLWESEPRLRVVTNANSGTLQVKVQYYRYVAFIGNTYTAGLGSLTAIPAPAGF